MTSWSDTTARCQAAVRVPLFRFDTVGLPGIDAANRPQRGRKRDQTTISRRTRRLDKLMRVAPRWRAFLPTSRQIRFALTRWLDRIVPGLMRRGNLHVREGDWRALASGDAMRWTKVSEDPLPEATAAEQSGIFALEQERSGSFHRGAAWHFEMAEFARTDVLTHSGQLIEPGSGLSLTPVHRNTARPARLVADVQYGPTISFVPPRTTRNYYHFVIEETVLMRDILDRACQRHHKLTALVRQDPPAFEAAYREAIRQRYPGLSFREVPADRRIACAPLVAHAVHYDSPYRSPPDRADLLRTIEAYRDLYGIAPARTGLQPLLVSRSDARIRNLVNEDVLAEQLSVFDTRRLSPGTVSHVEQVAAFSKARVIVGAHGAGLTNLIFAPPGTPVIEIFGKNYCQGAYMWLCHLLGHPYYPVVSPLEGSHQNITLPEDLLDKIATRVAKAVTPN